MEGGGKEERRMLERGKSKKRRMVKMREGRGGEERGCGGRGILGRIDSPANVGVILIDKIDCVNSHFFLFPHFAFPWREHDGSHASVFCA